RILHHLFSTLNSSSTPRHWDAHAQQQLLNNLHRHIASLEHCLTDSATRLTSCAWDLVRLEARACFQRLHNLTRTTHN
ncbi:PREDICTED: interferon-like, partial [Buceros rhinoceros silvestris]|uniref:interferon-like n=1 Tax=Buceros rhinoceros silvestris TaxID=175836 RepID=UPI000528334E